MRHKRDWARETVLRCHSDSGRTGVSCENTRRRDSAERDSESRHSYYPISCGLQRDSRFIEPARVEETVQAVINGHSLRIPGRTLEEDTRTRTRHSRIANREESKVTRGRTPSQRGESHVDNTRTIIRITPRRESHYPTIDTARSGKRHRYSRAQSNSHRIKNRYGGSAEADIDVDTRHRWPVRNINLKGNGSARSGQGHSRRFD